MNHSVEQFRPPQALLSAERIAAIVPTPLSFPRMAMRELVRGRWQVRKLRFELDAQGRGEVLYRLEGAGWTFHFFLISQKLPEELKTDRNFAASWDAMGVLCQGDWTLQREAWLRREVPKQRAGFADYDTLMYARGNRSARVFDHVVDSLARGEQPDLRQIAPVGYILRTTAFIGNGQLGTRAYAGFEPDHPLRRPYHAQFCSAFMLREYVFDLVDHMARARSPNAVRLAPAWRRYLGLGNSAATGLAAFVANHPHLIDRWTRANEEAAAQARQVPARPDGASVRRMGELLDKAIRHFDEASRPDDNVFLPPQALARELERLRSPMAEFRDRGTIGGQPVDRPWAALCNWARGQLHAEAFEVLQAMLLEVHPEVVDRFTDAFQAREQFEVDPTMSAGELAASIERHYDWALQADPPAGALRNFWYRCASAPRDVRRGPRGGAPEWENETTLDTRLQLGRLRDYLSRHATEASVAEVTCARPDLRHIVARVQSLAHHPYAELRQDYLHERFSPFATIRFPLTFFGMEKLEAAPPKSVRGVFMQGAPIAEDVAAGRDGDWPFPLVPDAQGPQAMDELAPIELAPMPHAGLGAVDYATARNTEPSAPRTIRIAPGELARMVQAALQGHGASLGVAEEAGALAVLAQCCGEPAVATVLAHCAQGQVRTTGARELRDPQRSGPVRAVLRVDGGSALTAAPAAFDLALARSVTTGHALGACLVTQAADAWLAQHTVLRCAGGVRFALAAWQARDRAGALFGGFALAVPDGTAAALIQGRLPALAAVHLAMLQASDDTLLEAGGLAALADPASPPRWAGQIAALLGPVVDAAPDAQAQGMVLVIGPAPAEGATHLVHTLEERGIEASCWSAAEFERRQSGWLRQGVELEASQFDALAEAGKALLVPQSEEPRFLPPGFDPLKNF